MIDYNGQVLSLCPWPAVRFSSPILLNRNFIYIYNDRRVKWPCTRCCWTTTRDVPVGKGRYSYQTPTSLVGMVRCMFLVTGDTIFWRHMHMCNKEHVKCYFQCKNRSLPHLLSFDLVLNKYLSWQIKLPLHSFRCRSPLQCGGIVCEERGGGAEFHVH